MSQAKTNTKSNLKASSTMFSVYNNLSSHIPRPTDFPSTNNQGIMPDNMYISNPRQDNLETHDPAIQTVIDALFESEDSLSDQAARRQNSQTNSFTSIDMNLREMGKTAGNKNGNSRMPNPNWTEQTNQKFSNTMSNIPISKSPGFENQDSNFAWRSMPDIQQTSDRVFIERIEPYIQSLVMNHNKICPFNLEINKTTVSKICAFYFQSKKRFYLADSECYVRFTNSIISPVQLTSQENLLKASLNFPPELATIEKDAFGKVNKRSYFVTIEGSHPISTLPLFRIEKTAVALEHSVQKNQILLLDLANRMPLLFDSNSYHIPFEEFKLTISVHMTHSNQDPTVFEFLVDLSKVPANKVNLRTPLEILVNANGNSILVGTEILFSSNTKLQTYSQEFISLDFGKSVVLSLKHLIFSLPFKPKSHQQSGVESPNLIFEQFNQPSTIINPFNSPPQFYPNQEYNLTEQEVDKNAESPHFQPQKRQIDVYTPEQPLINMNPNKSDNLPPGIIISPPSNNEPKYEPPKPELKLKIGILSRGTSGSLSRGNSGNYEDNAFSKYEEDKDTLDTSPISDFNGDKKNNLMYRHDSLNRQDSSGSVRSDTQGNKNPNQLARSFSGYSTHSGETFQQPPQNSDEQQTNFSEEMIENFRLADHIGNLVEYAKSYQGSRILQKFFPRANQNEIDEIIHEIQYKIDELMLDPYANYMFQSLAQSCSADQRFFLLQKIAPSMARVACDRKGTHSLQGIVSLINRECEDKLIQEAISDKILELSLDPQGTHLIQKLIVSISINNINFIYDQLILKFVEVANHSFGVCVLKQLMTKVEKSETHKKKIIELLYHNIENLIQNPFGNYIIQHALDVFPKECNNILDRIVDKVIQYSNQKFSSNVVEKCLVFASEESKKRYFAEILKGDRLLEMMKNKYGNYVINKSIAHADPEDKQAIIQAIARCVNSINVSKYRTRWIQFLEEMNSKPHPGNITRPSIFRTGSNNMSDSEKSNKQSDNSELEADDSPNMSKRDFDRTALSKFYYQSGVGKGSNDSIGSGTSPTVHNKQNGHGSSTLKPKGNNGQQNHNGNGGNGGGSPKKGKGNQNQKYYVEKGNKNSYYNS